MRMGQAWYSDVFPVADIFISYASEDRERAGRLAQAFGAMGWSVWWDRRIIVGQAFDRAIEREIEAAKSVVLLWSKASIGSEWVRNEAAAGAGRGVLVPATLDPVQLPLEFRSKQTADLTDWNGDPSHGGFQAVCEGITALIGGQPTPPARVRAESPPRNNRRFIGVGVAILAVLVGLGIYRLGPSRPVEGGEIADRATGTYLGNISADSKGSSRSDVFVTVTKVNRTRVRVSSDNARIGTFEVELNRIGDNLFNAGGDSTFIAYTTKTPPEVVLSARGEVSYGGTKQKK